MRTVHHVLFTSWPNYGVVDDVTRLTQLVKRVNKSNTAMLCTVCFTDFDQVQSFYSDTDFGWI